MADKEEAEEGDNSTRGSDWEVVSLTASAYAASPGPKEVVESKDDENEELTSHPLYMSSHFVVPPSELTENLATEPNEVTEIYAEQENEPDSKKHEEDLTMKEMNLSGLEFVNEKDKGEEGNIYKTAVSSLQDERIIGGSHVEPLIHEQTEEVSPPGVVPSDLNPNKDDEKHEVPPCEAWWKRSAASLISQAKETKTVWSIFIAAAVMGIIILGQRWQHERWQILQLKWESRIGNEKAGKMMGPISRLKQAIVGGQQRDSFIRVSYQNES